MEPAHSPDNSTCTSYFRDQGHVFHDLPLLFSWTAAGSYPLPSVELDVTVICAHVMLWHAKTHWQVFHLVRGDFAWIGYGFARVHNMGICVHCCLCLQLARMHQQLRPGLRHHAIHLACRHTAADGGLRRACRCVAADHIFVEVLNSDRPILFDQASTARASRECSRAPTPRPRSKWTATRTRRPLSCIDTYMPRSLNHKRKMSLLPCCCMRE